MAIPMSALRRALAEMADMSGSASLRRSIPAALNNTVGASLGGASLGAAGGLLANMPDDELGETTSEYGNRLMRGIGTGAAIGAGLGAGGVGIAGARGLRAALAEAAAERGIGRAAAREASHVDDAARFAEASEGRRGMMQRVGDYISENPEEVALAGAGASMGVLGGGGLLAIGGGMAAQYQRAQQATGIEDLTMMTPQELAVLGSPKLGEQSAEGEMLRQQAVEIMRQRQKMAQ